ncbi:MAG: glycosyltransferase [Leptolyngbyaceae cyanobacterium SM1_4_3]|nr:glycosyltransferase [Leptolyngbyaceae cyanobacterium SM1_4_3]NJN89383.1 glycosyltransferase [Leptolyngbyaceae cyanobacterium SL_5_14]NJO66137.1 glycosyltransferase [Leptolyngbyaceae cyanobacterium RM1_405_57]
METAIAKPITTQPTVTIVVGPRERFSHTRESLESIYRNTDYPFELVYVDVCTPTHIQRYLQEQAQEKGFQLIRTAYYISPNQARNVGLRYVLSQARTDYVVFLENDVVVEPDWLTKLVECAEETGATIVGPLTCIGKPEHGVIHNAGGETYIFTDVKSAGKIKRRLRQKAYLTGRAIADVRDQIRRTQCDYVEFHCMMARTAIFDQIGLLDEEMLATREHIDLCLTVLEAGGSIYCERESVVTTDTVGVAQNKKGLVELFGATRLPDFKWFDLPYFMVRWSDAWDLASLHHLRDKWNLTEDSYFKKRYAGIGGRRRELLIEPLVQRLTFGKGNPWLESFLSSVERQLNHYFYSRYLKQKKRILSQEQELQTVIKDSEQKQLVA